MGKLIQSAETSKKKKKHVDVYETTYDENSGSPTAGVGSGDGAVFVVDNTVEEGSCGLRSVDGHFCPSSTVSPYSQRERERELMKT